MTKSQKMGGMLLLCVNIVIMLGLYAVPYSSSEKFVLPHSVPDSVNHLLVFNGYVTCPVICPTNMRHLAMLDEQLVSEQFYSSLQTVFVNLESQRKYGQSAEQFAKGFNKRFTGWQLPASEQKQWLEDLHTYYLTGNEKRKTEPQHSPNVYLLNRDQNTAEWTIGAIYTRYPIDEESLKKDCIATFK